MCVCLPSVVNVIHLRGLIKPLQPPGGGEEEVEEGWLGGGMVFFILTKD